MAGYETDDRPIAGGSFFLRFEVAGFKFYYGRLIHLYVYLNRNRMGQPKYKERKMNVTELGTEMYCKFNKSRDERIKKIKE
jgi:hypothetical protein